MKKKPYLFACIFAVEIQSYLALRKSQGHRAEKERLYFITLDRYLQAECTAEKHLTPTIVDGWLQALPAQMHVNTKQNYVLHYTCFARYLHTLGFTAFIPELPRREYSYVPYIFSQDELERLFTAADGCMMTKNCRGNSRLQIPLIFRLLYGCGLRLDEVLLLRAGNVNLEAGTLLICNAKDNKDRLVPMDISLVEILRQYMKAAAKTVSQELLFDNGRGERRSQAWARDWFRWILDEAGIVREELPRYSRNICPHCLRHTFAVNSFRKQDIAGVDLYAAAPLLSTYMGHVKVYGTERYLHMTAENSKDILDKTSAYTEGLFPEVPQ